MDTDSFFVHVKTENIYKDVKIRLDTSNCQLDRPLPKKKN